MSQRTKRGAAHRRVARSTQLESLESRQVMAADPLGMPSLTTHNLMIEEPPLELHGGGMSTAIVESAPVRDPDADFWFDGLDYDPIAAIDELERRIDQTLNDAHGLTGQDEVLDRYGFTGAGQTVAVIDTGLAYTHTALGAGLGAGHRVVGGWDFAENDADFYDEGPEGGHGTHVAGIVGAVGGTHSGVATGVDLVGLRVFDDAGNGYFSRVEDALEWVYDNRASFENPITAVNLSLGTSWNSDNIPAWANLEDEFAALESVGIFVSVSAGNDYQDYNANGVSYPAASDHVIPVMSVDNSGNLSYFSQRAEYAIAAPGRWITSTVPDYSANDSDTIDDDWLSMSGTSMAAPYVAGASVLVREAMEFVGQTDIDQWDIYNHMMATADEFFDSASQTTFKRLNLEAAIDALMPTDDYGSTVETAHSLGTISDTSGPGPLSTVAGVVSTLDDVDYFTFTSGVNGTVTFTATSQSHDLDVDWLGVGGNGSVESGGDAYVMQVASGQTYSIAVSSSNGLGYYDLQIDAESLFAPIEWGAASAQTLHSGLSIDGEGWYRLTAGRDGYFTAQTLPQVGTAGVEIYDSQQQLLAGVGSGRADAIVAAGQEILIRVTGNSSDFDLRVTNALTVADGVASMIGTTTADTIGFETTAGGFALSLNEVGYQINSGDASQILFDGAGGADTFDAAAGAAAESVVMRADLVEAVSSDGWSLSASGFTTVDFDAGSGQDDIVFYDTVNDDTLVVKQATADLFTYGQWLRGSSFESVTAYNGHQSGLDRAYLYGGDSDDTFTGRAEYSRLVGGGHDTVVYAYDRVDAYAGGGNNRAYQYDSAGDDLYTGRPEYASMRGDNFVNVAHGFDRVDGYTTGGGTDRAYLYDSAGSDIFVSRPAYAHMTGEGFKNILWGFERVDAYPFAGGNDIAYMYGSAGADRFVGRPNYSLITGEGFYNLAWYFETVYAFGESGDTAYLYGQDPSDVFFNGPSHSYTNGDGFYYYAKSFGTVYNYPAAASTSQSLGSQSIAQQPAQSSSTPAILSVSTQVAVRGDETALSVSSDRADRAVESTNDRIDPQPAARADLRFASDDDREDEFDRLFSSGDETDEEATIAFDEAFSGYGV